MSFLIIAQPLIVLIKQSTMNPDRQKKLTQPAGKATPMPRKQASPPSRSPSNIALKSDIKRTPKSPLPQLDNSDEDISSTDKEDFLLLQIKQLKRENNFLKKKISEMTIEHGPERKPRRTNREKGKAATSNNLEIMPLSINIFFEEIHNLLNTIVKLFKVQFSEEETSQFEEKYAEIVQETCPIKRFHIMRKYHLKRKLEKMMLSKEEERYPLCLELFTDYYGYKEEADNKVIKTIDLATSRAHELNQMVINKVQAKKSRSTLSLSPNPSPHLHPPSSAQPTARNHPGQRECRIETLHVPSSPTQPGKNFVAANKMNAFSPAQRRNQPASKYQMSPAQRVQRPSH